jgi:hypothetical protein
MDMWGGSGGKYSTNNEYCNNYINDSDNYGIRIENSADSFWVNNTVYESYGNELYLDNSIIEVYNSSIIDNLRSPSYKDILLDWSWLTLTNSFFDHESVDISVPTAGPKADLTVKWYLDVKVVNLSNSPIDGANVSIYYWNKSGSKYSLLSTHTTSSNGYIPQQTITEYTQTNNSNILSYNPYVITARKEYSTNSTGAITLNSSQTVILQLNYVSTTSTTTTTTSTSTSTTTIHILSQNITQNISANVTTQVNASNVNLTLDFVTSSNVSEANISVTYYSGNPSNTSLSVPSLNKYYEVDVSPSLTNAIEYTFLKIYYTQQEVAAKGLDETRLAIYWLNESLGAWQKLNNNTMSWVYATGVNETDDYTWANLTHFSLYAIGAGMQSQEIGLITGWNLISLPLNL